MGTFLYTFLGIIVGGIITYLVSKFYYQKSIKTKSLGVFVQFITEILSDIDPQVKTKLSVSYDTQKVDKLYQMQFIIANDGDLPIRGIIVPLSLGIPNKGIVLDVNIVHIEPDGRGVSYDIQGLNNEVKFNFPLLNSGEYFVAKLLIKGEPPKQQKSRRLKDSVVKQGSLKDKKGMEIDMNQEMDIYDHYRFSITADDLPPQIKPCELPYDYFEGILQRKRDFSSIIAGLVFGVMAFSFGYLLFSLKNSNPNLFLFNFNQFFSNFSFLSITIIASWLATAAILFVAIALPASDIDSFKAKKKPKFVLPNKLRYARGHWH